MTPSLPPPADASQRSASFRLQAGRRKTKKGACRKVTGGEILELRAPLAQGLGRKLGLSLLQQIERKKQGRCFSANFFTRLAAG